MMRIFCLCLAVSCLATGCLPLAVGAGAAGGVVVGKEMAD